MNNVAYVRDRRAQNAAGVRNRGDSCNKLRLFRDRPANLFEVHLYRDEFVE
jgi:hypothetical protein